LEKQSEPAMNATETYTRWRYRLIPDNVLGEVLSKNWMDNAIPFLLMLVTLSVFNSIVLDFMSAGSLSSVGRQLGEYLFVAFGMVIVLKAGGIDLSVGSVFALCNLLALALVNKFLLPLIVAIPLVIAAGALVGLINGLLIGYLRLRAFLTTLVTLIIVRAVVDLLTVAYGGEVSVWTDKVAGWDFIGDGALMGVPFSVVAAATAGVLVHILLTRMRLGWHISAVGGSRRSAFNIGLPVRRVVCFTYVLSGACTAMAATFQASRLGSAGSTVGMGLEILVLTAAVLGGNSLGGGRGSAVKAILGTATVVMITDGLVRMGLGSGVAPMVLGLTLLGAVAIDVRWLKNRGRVLQQAYVSPTYLMLPSCPSTTAESDSPFGLNRLLAGAQPIGLREVDGAEDVLLDDEDNLYCGSRHGDVVRFFGPDHRRWEIYAHIGGHPLGMAWNPEGELVTCVGGMGLYKITRERRVVKLSAETKRSLLSIIDDSRVRLPDDLDIAEDGRVFFSEATVRYDTAEWMIDALEGRGNGRILCYDPKTGSTHTVLRNLIFPNGICMTGDCESLLFAQTWACTITRYWYAGQNRGRSQVIIADLPGYPDNINRASDGNYWCGIVGMRAPAFDLALRMPQFRRRMVYRVAVDEWLTPNQNTGCVIKFDLNGSVLQTLWDKDGHAHAAVTSMREHRGHLYLGGIFNDRIGKLPIPNADPQWTGQRSYWGDYR
jgi:ribose transport system permease protein